MWKTKGATTRKRHAALRAALATGEDEVARGEVDRLTSELFERLRDEARRMDPAARDADPE